MSRLMYNLEQLNSLRYVPEDIFVSADTKICDPTLAGGQLLNVVTKKLQSYGHSSENISSRLVGIGNFLEVSYTRNETDVLASFVNTDVDSVDFFSMDSSMKFHFITKNSPYDTGIKTEYKLPFKNPRAAYVPFTVEAHNRLHDNGILFDVLPCNFMCLPSYKEFRQWLLANFEIINVTIWDNSDKQIFDINMSDIITLTMRKTPNPNNTKVKWVSYGGEEFDVDLTKYEYWPIYKNKISVSILDSVLADGHELRCAGSKELPNGHFISGNLTRQGARQNPEPRKYFQMNKLKEVKHPIWFGYSTSESNERHYNWMGTTHYAYVLSMLQCTPKNQPILFSYLKEHNFLDTNFDRHFGITDKQNAEMESWKKSIT